MTNTKDVKIATNLRKAANLLEKKGWCRGSFRKYEYDSNGDMKSEPCAFCAVGALQHVTNFNMHDERFAVEQHGPCNLMTWNDTVAKDKRYVIRLFRRVAKTLLGE